MEQNGSEGEKENQQEFGFEVEGKKGGEKDKATKYDLGDQEDNKT